MKRILLLTLFLNACMGASEVGDSETAQGCNEVLTQALVIAPFSNSGLLPLPTSAETVYLYPASDSNDIGSSEIGNVYRESTILETLTGVGIGEKTLAAARGSDLQFQNGLPVKGAPYTRVQNDSLDTIIVSVYVSCP